MPVAQHGLDVLCDVGVVQRILDVVGLAGAAVGQGDVEVDLQGLRRALFPFVDADQGGDLEFAQKNDVHCRFLFQFQIAVQTTGGGGIATPFVAMRGWLRWRILQQFESPGSLKYWSGKRKSW